MRVFLVAGARPNFMKVAPVLDAFHARRGSFPELQPLLIHTGQHYDPQMSDDFFRDLGMPMPDIYLGAGSGSHAEQTARVMVAFEKVCVEHQPVLVVVVGDVNSTLACAIPTKKLGIPVAHMEAGLRSRDMSMPEEINRLCTDVISEVRKDVSRRRSMRHLYGTTALAGRTHLPSLSGGGSAVAPNAWEDKL